jgi:hypothetical protein
LGANRFRPKFWVRSRTASICSASNWSLVAAGEEAGAARA